MQENLKDFDEDMMQRCFQLAKNGLGHVAPNPMVGCVITHRNKIIGEGFHRQYGEPHAEVNAIRSVKDSSLLADSTLYVNLEPCAHYGKTPPCADLIVSKSIPRVVISNVDPHAKVAGKGIEKLEAGGCKVSHGLLKKDGWFLNRRFFTYHTKKRPWIILKWAESADGYIDLKREAKDGKAPQWLTNQTAKHLVHKWRKEEQAILVGSNTTILDNPRLNTREWWGNSPVRILIDPDLSVPGESHLLDNSQPTLVFNYTRASKNGQTEYIKMPGSQTIIEQVLEALYARGIQSVIVEGGAMVLNSFIREGYWDEARRFIGEIHLGNGVKAPDFHEKPSESGFVGNAILHTYFNPEDAR